MSKIVVIGVGNIIRSDDGFGVHALRRLQQHPKIPADVIFVEGGTKGLELFGYAWEASHLLLIDAANAGQTAGTLIQMSGDELRSLSGGMSVHQLGVADLIASLTLASERPPNIVLLGVQPASTDWGTILTPRLEAALDPVVEVAIALLQSWAREGRRADSTPSV